MAFVVMIGICVLPALYAWFNIAANWDPYSNTGNIAVAVVNNDKGAELLSQKINAGEQIVSNLKQNDQMGWTFVSQSEAEKGVENGDYYASVTIPEDFSENLTGIFNGEFTRPEIIYTVNEKKNAIAPKITDKGAEAIKSEVDESFIDTITEGIASVLQLASESGEEKYTEIIDNITSALGEASDTLSTFEDSIKLVITALDSANTLIDGAKEGIPDLEKLLADSGTLTSSTKDAITAAEAASNQLTSSADVILSSVDTLYQSVEQDVSEATQLLSSGADQAAEKLRTTATVNQRIIDIENSLVTFFTGVGEKFDIDMTEVLNQLGDNISKQQSIIDKINSASDTISETGKAPENFADEINSLVSEAKSEFETTKNSFSSTTKPAIDNAVSKLFSTLDDATDVLNDVDGSVPDITSMLDESETSVDSIKDVLNNLNTTIDSAIEKLGTLKEKAASLKDNTALLNFIEELSENPESLGEFMSSPVEISTVKVYEVENYGSAMAPFYTILAIWVGSIVLVAVLKTEVGERDKKALGGKIRPIQLYFGRYLIFLYAALIQAVIIAMGDIFFLDIQCESPVLFVLTALLSTVTFSILIYSLTITFSVIGKALAVIILVLQVAGSGGTFPPEVLPDFFQALLPYLPFKYAINAMRETVAGVNTEAYVTNMLYLLIYIAAALIIGILLRKPCMKLMAFFNKRLDDTDLIV